MSIRRVTRRWLRALLVAGLTVAGLDTFAATLELRLLSPEGSAVSGIGVVAIPGTSRWGTSIDCGVSGADGRAVCAGLPVGRASLRLTIPRGSDFITINNQSLDSLIAVTVTSADETVRLDIPLPRADQVSLELECYQCGANWQLLLEEEGTQSRQVLSPSFYQQRPKLPLTQGRWHLTMTSPQGHLLQRLEVDGNQVPGATAVLDVGDGGREHVVSWQFFAPAHVSGTVHWDIGPDPPCAPTAALITAGPALTAALARGGSYASTYQSTVNRQGDYSLTLPDGRWQLQCASKTVASVTPDPAVVDLVVGDRKTVDFNAVVKPLEEDPARLTVHVSGPKQHAYERVVVELWKVSESPGVELLVKRTDTFSGSRAGVSFSNLAEGSYRVAAGSAHTGEASTSLRLTRGDEQSVDLTLPSGALLRGTLQLPDKTKPIAVELSVEAEPPPANPLVTDPKLRLARDKRTLRFDATGKLEEPGLSDGTYRVSARILDATASLYFVELVRGEQHSRDPLSLTISNGVTVEIGVRLNAAAQMLGALHCEGGAGVPRRVEVRTVAAGTAPPAETAAPYEIDALEAVTAYESVLTGDHLDVLRIGPVEPQKRFVALRPIGFSRWTWVVQTEDPTRASPVWLQIDADNQLGPITLDCAASLKLLPHVASGQSLPDISDLRATVEARRLPRPGFDEPPGEWRELRLDRHADFVRVRGLPQGRFELRARLSHRLFVPALATLDTAALTRLATAGGEAPLELSIGAIGGTVLVKTEYATLRVSSADGSVQSATGENLPAGSYTVETCADEACKRLLQTWKDVAVTAGATVELP